MKIVIIGNGNMAQNLRKAFAEKKIEVAIQSSYEGLDMIAQNADVYIYAVSDNALAEVIDKVHTPAKAMHLHTSGTVPISVFGEDKPHCGVFYPLQTFSKDHLIEDFSAIPVFFEARGIDDVSAIYSLALTLTTHVYETTQAERDRLHLAGVFANNFSNAMFGIAAELVKGTHVPANVLLPIIDETAAKIHYLQPNEAQTGPARRGDQNTIDKHLKMITSAKYKEIYEMMTQFISATYK